MCECIDMGGHAARIGSAADLDHECAGAVAEPQSCSQRGAGRGTSARGDRMFLEGSWGTVRLEIECFVDLAPLQDAQTPLEVSVVA